MQSRRSEAVASAGKTRASKCDFLGPARLLLFAISIPLAGSGQPMLPGGTLDADTIPKYVTPLVFPPVMPNDGNENEYKIAVREFQQQILPGGPYEKFCRKRLRAAHDGDRWEDRHDDDSDRRREGRHDDGYGCGHPATTVWSYGPASMPVPKPGSRHHVAPDPSSGFNYPAFTFEARSNVPVKVRWINELVRIDDRTGFPYPIGSRKRKALKHLFAVDQTLHWANPPMDCAFSPEHGGTLKRTDCAGQDPTPYRGPVPIVTHVHGSHVQPESDGYPEAWWLPRARHDWRFPRSYAKSGTFFDDVTHENPGDLGFADFEYENSQPATTLWYHDHTLGITRLNVYAGPAGFWLIRGGAYDTVFDAVTYREAVLPGPAPQRGDTLADLNTPGATLRNSIREIPLLVQDRSFNADGSLFYPNNRAYFETLNGTRGRQRRQFKSILGPDGKPYIGKLSGKPDRNRPFEFGPPQGTSDPKRKSMVPPMWNVETFFDTMVVNGTTWPTLDVAPARYRMRFLNGSNTRTLNLALFYNSRPGLPGRAGACEPLPGNRELPVVQIGSDGGFLPKAVEIRTGFATSLKGNGSKPTPDELHATPYQEQALLLAPAERADVIVDFGALPDGTIVRITNTAPDSPFGGFNRGDPAADCSLSGQVMEFVVRHELLTPQDAKTTSAYAMRPHSKRKLGAPDYVREISVNEQDSDFGISHNRDDVFVPANRYSTVGEIPDDGFYPVCAQKACTRRAIDTPPCDADKDCPAGLSVSGFDPDGLDCWDPNLGKNAYKIFQRNIDLNSIPPDSLDGAQCEDPGLSNSGIYGPMVDLLGTVKGVPGISSSGVPLRWTDDSGDSASYSAPATQGKEIVVQVTEDPALGSVESWKIYNFTPDAHPIHLHLVQFNVKDRQPIRQDRTVMGNDYIPRCGDPCISADPPTCKTDVCYDRKLTGVVFPQEEGWKDTVIAHPGQVTTVRARFDIEGLYVWHCHILEHEDNEMMRPFFVKGIAD